ncbi:phosphorylated carbohydrates phosphatase [mine drainage metagenome]|uniref:Phosphorylated carbohydrates phosphatase n=1 Tax=mine drainage metagenome TaxID=410659 RepID=A0A1J5QZJ7_9ZZZZ
MLEALIFDVDGTLAETEEAHRAAFNQAFAELDLPWRWDPPLYARLLAVSGGRERLRHYAETCDPQRAGPDCAPLLAALHRRKTEIYTAMVRDNAVPFRPGVVALSLAARAAGLRLAVATTTSRANVLALFDGTGGDAHAWFETLACADDAPRKKPDPAVYRVALERLGLPPRSCLAIEDSANGVGAALAAGLPVVATRGAYTANDDLSGALAVFPDLAAVSLADLQGLWRRTAPHPPPGPP